ncbi:hypothetical protein [Achromobacter xylosoxidans]|uniref:hypothetical protein n=1 Tax=Alcaligenes xylosoxydans xylosoxydans TaxID=85698 RepID=UPI0012A803C6|nr:hypothetical protein [Achromobacter xylosoxidans]CUR70321.1 hypothetical protein BN2877_57680 [Achromobacter xylosoxidans]
MTTPQSRLLKLADEAVADYNATHAAGGEAVYPSWVEDVRLLCNAAPSVATAGNPQPARDWELTCHECDGSGHVYVKHQVAERQSDVQEFKEECECCEGRGFVFAFQDIPGIEECVKACRTAPAAGDAQELLDALIEARRELHACQAVIHYAGGFDPAYVRDAQAAIKRADAAIAAQQGQDGR